jgi:hypothetical protein
MKQVLEQEKAWEMIRGAKAADGQIISATIHIKVSEGPKGVDFFKSVRELIHDGFDQPRGRVVVVWGERALDIENSATFWFYFGTIKASELLKICRRFAGKAGFGEFGQLRVTCTIEFPSRNRVVTLNDLSYPAKGGECIADTQVLKPFKAVSSTGEYMFHNVHELKEFLKSVKDAESYIIDEKTGKWVRWVEIEQKEDTLIISIPTQKGHRRLLVDLATGKVQEKK